MSTSRFLKLATVAAALTVTVLPATVQAADGAAVFKKCMACHTLEPGKSRVGPSLAGVVGRKAGTAEGYNRYKGLKGADWTWTVPLIEEYLKDPTAFTKPRTGERAAMAFKLSNEDERVAVAEYLKAH